MTWKSHGGRGEVPIFPHRASSSAVCPLASVRSAVTTMDPAESLRSANALTVEMITHPVLAVKLWEIGGVVRLWEASPEWVGVRWGVDIPRQCVRDVAFLADVFSKLVSGRPFIAPQAVYSELEPYRPAVLAFVLTVAEVITEGRDERREHGHPGREHGPGEERVSPADVPGEPTHSDAGVPPNGRHDAHDERHPGAVPGTGGEVERDAGEHRQT